MAERTEGPLGYLVLAAASAIEYIIPPLPGDTVTLFGTFLAATAGHSVALGYVSQGGRKRYTPYWLGSSHPCAKA